MPELTDGLREGLDGYVLEYVRIVYIKHSPVASVSDRQAVLIMSPTEALEFLKRVEVQG